jgi:polysaccharide biosynthesis/export protein
VDEILSNRDQTTNVILQPSDQILVGETRRSSFSRLLPEWFLPVYRKLVGLLPPDVWPIMTPN